MRILRLTCIILVCLCAVSRAQDFDSLQNIRVTVTFASPPASWSVSKAPLRYNKSFAYSYQMDDGAKDIWTNGYPLFNGGVIGSVTYPGLKYTDGCGNDKSFRMSCSLYSFNATGSTAVDVHDPNSAYATVNVTWPQLVTMCQNDWGISNHGLSPGNAGNYNYEIARNHSYVKLKTQAASTGGIDMGIFVNPNGDQAYTQPAFSQGYLACYRDGYSFGQPSFDVNGTWSHKDLMMGRTNTWNAVNISALVDALAAASTGGANHWAVHFTHAINNATWGYDFETFKNHMNYIAGKYGKNGYDNIWMATEEEVLDYLLIRDAVTVHTQMADNILQISFSGNIPDTYRYYNATLLLNSDTPIISITAQGVSSSSYTGTGQTSGMINLSWNGKFIIPPEQTAETWVSKAEQTHSQDDANIAMDYVLMVPDGPVQQAFRVRLCSIPGVTMPDNFCTFRNAPVTSVPILPGCPATSVSVPVLVAGFTDITSVTLTLEYDPAVLTFLSGVAARPLVTPGMQFSDEAVGGTSSFRKTVITWTSSTAASLSSQDTLAFLTFGFASGATSLLFNTTESTGTSCEYKDENGRPMYDLPATDFYLGGQVSDSSLTAPDTISGLSLVCAGSQNLVYTVSPVPGALSYAWILPPGYNPVTGSTSDTLQISLDAMAVSGDIYVRAVNVCTNNPLSPPLHVTVKPPPIPTINGDSSLCIGSSGVLYSTEAGMTGYSWTVSQGGTITSGANTATVTVNWDSAGNRSLSAVYTGTDGCSTVIPTVKPVTVHPYPVPLIIGDASACVGQSGAVYSTESGMSGYEWTITSGGIITAGVATQAVTVTWIDTGIQVISVRYTDTNGCTNPVLSSGIVHVNPLPIPVITGNYSLCNGRTGIVYATQNNMSDYTWTVSPGGMITGGTGTHAVTVDWSQSGNQYVTVNYTDANGCSAPNPTNYPVTVFPLPLPTITGFTALCLGNTAVYSTQSGMSCYTWTIPAGGTILSGSGTSQVAIHWDSAGSRSVYVNYSDLNGCTASSPSALGITVHPLPVPSLSGSDTVCNQSTVTYTTDPGMTGYQWLVSPGGFMVGGAGTNQVQITWLSTGLQSVSISYTDINGCTPVTPTLRSVFVLPLPVPVITGPASVCDQSAGINYATDPGMSDYTWNISSGGIITSGNGTSAITVNWNSTGSQWISVSYMHTNGCYPQNTAVFPVTVGSLPQPVITGTSSCCEESSGVIYTTQAGNSNYQWTVTPGGSIVAGNGSYLVVVDWNLPGLQTLSVSYTDLYGCIPAVPATKNVMVHTVPVPTISGEDSVCNNGSSAYITESGMMSYQWNISAGGIITSGTGTSTIQVQWTVPGNQSVSVNYSTPEGCTAQTPATFLVSVFPVPQPGITGTGMVCAGATGITYMTDAGMSGYLWSVTGGGVITTGQGTQVITVDWPIPGLESVLVSYTSPSGCTSAQPTIYPVTVNPVPVPVIIGETSFCVNAGTQLYSTQAGQLYYFWNVSSGGSIVGGQGTPNLEVSWNTAGDQWVSCTYTSPSGCAAAQPDTLDLFIDPVPQQPGAITGDDLVCAPCSWIQYMVDPVVYAINYVWTLPAGVVFSGSSNSNIIHVNYLPWAQSGDITVHGTNGCGDGPASNLTVVVTPVPETPVITQPQPGMLESTAPAGNQWYLNNQAIPGATGQTLYPDLSGYYHTVVTNNGCISDPSNIIQVAITGDKELPGTAVEIIPNPNHGKFLLRLTGLPEGKVTIRIFTVPGIVVKTLILTENKGIFEEVIELTEQAAGRYVLVVDSGPVKLIFPVIVL